MLDLKLFGSLGAALRDALNLWPDEVCLIEADRERERSQLTYRQFREAAEPLAAALEDSGFAAGERAAIIMTNQPKWLISAYATFFAGGVVVPLDYKLSAEEHLQLLAHSRARVLFVEYPHWRAITQVEAFREHKLHTILVTEAPPTSSARNPPPSAWWISLRSNRLRPRRGCRRVNARFTRIKAFSARRFPGGNAANLSRRPRCKFFKISGTTAM